MTCIVGIADGKKVWIGSDSALNTPYIRSVMSAGKIFKVGNLLLGSSGSPRDAEILQYQLVLPKQSKGKDFKYLSAVVITAMQSILESNNSLKIDNGIASSGSTYLLGYNGKLYTVYSDFQVAHYKAPYTAIGSGGEVALGSLYSTIGLKPRKRIKIALSAANQFSRGVAKPFHIMSI